MASAMGRSWREGELGALSRSAAASLGGADRTAIAEMLHLGRWSVPVRLAAAIYPRGPGWSLTQSGTQEQASTYNHSRALMSC